MQTPPEYLVAILPGIITLISAWLTHAKLPESVNALISGVIVLVSALVWALIGGKLAGDLVTDFVLIAGYSAALVAGPLKPLHQWLMYKIPSPFGIFFPAPAESDPQP
ncbi:MAG: hypothetical protein IMW89_22385 [Ktedonobacteraceae bacterium]|nr:hypothetical protein [Ktedonobacteraceae bacterium]